MFVKNIISGSIIIPDKLRISVFKPQGLRRIIESIPPDNYILGVGYKEGDHQICISGKKKSGELLGDAIKRETQEELSLSFNTEPKIVLKYGKNYFYKININQTILTNSSYNINYGLDTNERVVCCVHGLEKDILNYLENVELDINNCDRITHIWTDKAKNLLKYI